jgi:hypothetical protein
MMHTPFRHPLATHAAGTILGRRRNGSPIYAIAGGNGEGEGGSGSDGSTGAGQSTGQTAADGQQTGTTADSAQQGATSTGQTGAVKETGTDLAATVARLEKDLAAARKDAGAARVNAKQAAADEARAELAQQIGKALGLVKDDTPPDPAELTKQITAHTARVSELESALRAKDVELAVHAAAEKHQAKVSALLDSRSFLRAIGSLDPAAKSFPADLDTAIKTAIDSNPSFRTAPQAGRSGADLTGGPGETGKSRPTSIGAAVRGLYSQ